jgi:hypothetical protein
MYASTICHTSDSWQVSILTNIESHCLIEHLSEIERKIRMGNMSVSICSNRYAALPRGNPGQAGRLYRIFYPGNHYSLHRG